MDRNTRQDSILDICINCFSNQYILILLSMCHIFTDLYISEIRYKSNEKVLAIAKVSLLKFCFTLKAIYIWVT